MSQLAYFLFGVFYKISLGFCLVCCCSWYHNEHLLPRVFSGYSYFPGLGFHVWNTWMEAWSTVAILKLFYYLQIVFAVGPYELSMLLATHEVPVSPHPCQQGPVCVYTYIFSLRGLWRMTENKDGFSSSISSPLAGWFSQKTGISS